MMYIRSILFNILFYAVWTPLVCIALMPSLLMPRKITARVAATYQKGEYYLEKYILGLDYELRGVEHRPANNQPYLVASKHYSAYETMRLYQLFDDPTIILKKELLMIPIFGWFLKKLEVIAVDRGNKNEARQSLYEGAKKMRAQGRPIVIFPQGTRVKIDATTREKPYKGGIIKLYNEVNLPILPVAMNSGLYWPRNSFWKKSGKVIIEFLPMIPVGLPPEQVMKTLEEQIETHSARLVEEGRRSLAK